MARQLSGSAATGYERRRQGRARMKVAKTAKKSAKGWAGYKVAKGAGKTVKRKARRGPSTRERVAKIAGAVGITAAIAIVLAKLDRRKAVGKAKGAVRRGFEGHRRQGLRRRHARPQGRDRAVPPRRRAQGPGLGQRQRRRGRAARRARRPEADRRARRERPQDRRRQGRPQPAAHRHERRLATARNNEGGAAVDVEQCSATPPSPPRSRTSASARSARRPATPGAASRAAS